MAQPQQAQVVAVEFYEDDDTTREQFYLLTFPLGEVPPRIIDPKALTRLYPVATYSATGSMYVRRDLA